MSLGARSLVVAAVLACGAAGAVQILVAQRYGTLEAFALPAAAAVAVVIARKPIAGLQLALLAIPLEFASIAVGGQIAMRITELLLLATAGAALVHWALSEERPDVPPALMAIAGLCLVVALSYAVADDRLIVTKILAMWSAFTVVGVLAANAPTSELHRVLVCLAVGGGIAGFIAVGGGTDQELLRGGVAASNRAQGSFAQPNVLAFFLALAIPPAVVLASRGDSWLRAFMALMAVGAIWGLMLSLSRTGLVGTLLALCVLLLWPPFRRVAVIGLAALTLFTMFNFEAIERSHEVSVVSERLATLGRTSAVQRDPRRQIWSEAPRMVAERPLLGVGAGNFSTAGVTYGLVDNTGMPYLHAHNVALTFAVELGVAGLLLLLWLLWLVAGMALRATRQRWDPETGPLGLSVAASMVAAAVTSLGDYPPGTNAIAATFIVLVGTLAGLQRRDDQPAPSSR
jgi:O-antigen ligase